MWSNTSSAVLASITVMWLMGAFTADAQPFGTRISLNPTTHALPSWLAIQSAAAIDSTRLVVWGTVAAGPVGGPVGVLMADVVRGVTPLGPPWPLTNADARPFGYVQVIALRTAFLVVWNDARERDSAVYARLVSIDGLPINTEQRLGKGLLSAEGAGQLYVAGSATRGLALAWNSREGALLVHIDVATNTIGEARRLAGAIRSRRTYRFWPDCAVVQTADSGAWLVFANGTLDPRRLQLPDVLPYHLNADTSLLVLAGDTLLTYRTAFDTVPVRRHSIRALDTLGTRLTALAVDSSGRTHVAVFGVTRSDSTGTWVLSYDLRLGFGGVPDTARIIGAVRIDRHDLPMGNPHEFIVEGRYEGGDVVFGCDNATNASLRFTFMQSIRGSTQPEQHSTIHYVSDGYSGWNTDTNRFSMRCGPSFPPMCTRVSDSNESRVRLDIGRGVELRAEQKEYTRAVPQVTPAITALGGTLVVAWMEPGSAPRFIASRWQPATGLPATTLEAISFENLVGGENARSVINTHAVVPLPGVAIVASHRHLHEYYIEHASPTTWGMASRLTDDGAIAIADTFGWNDLLQTHAEDSQHFYESKRMCWTENRAAAVDPATGDILVMGRIVSPDGIVGMFSAAAYRRNGTTVWEAKLDADARFVIPAGDRRLLSVGRTGVFLRDTSHVLERYTLADTLHEEESFQRLAGRRFLRWFRSDSAHVTLQAYDLECALQATTVLAIPSSASAPAVVENGADGSLVLIHASPEGISAVHLSESLRHISERVIARASGVPTHPAALIAGDSLMAVWSETRDGDADIYGIAIRTDQLAAEPELSPLPGRPPSRDEADDAMRLTVSPVPTRDRLHVGLPTLAGHCTWRLDVVSTSGPVRTVSVPEASAGGAFDMDVSDLAPGAYFVRLQGTGAVARVIIVR